MSSARDEDALYQEHILDHYESPYHRGRCPSCTHAHEDDNPLCGDFVHIDLEIADGQIKQAWFDGDGCCISQASASMLLERIEGLSIDEARTFSAADMLELFGAKLTPNRQKCCLLAWRVLQEAFFAPLAGRGGVSENSESATSGDAAAETAPQDDAANHPPRKAR